MRKFSSTIQPDRREAKGSQGARPPALKLGRLGTWSRVVGRVVKLLLWSGLVSDRVKILR